MTAVELLGVALTQAIIKNKTKQNNQPRAKLVTSEVPRIGVSKVETQRSSQGQGAGCYTSDTVCGRAVNGNSRDHSFYFQQKLLTWMVNFLPPPIFIELLQLLWRNYRTDQLSKQNLFFPKLADFILKDRLMESKDLRIPFDDMIPYIFSTTQQTGNLLWKKKKKNKEKVQLLKQGKNICLRLFFLRQRLKHRH